MRVGDPEHVVTELFGEPGALQDRRRRHVGREAHAELDAAHARPPDATGTAPASGARAGITSAANRSIERCHTLGSGQSVAPMRRPPKPPTDACSSRILRTTVAGLPTIQTLSHRYSR